MPEPAATIVIVNYNGAHLLPACLSALRRSTLPAPAWVVDNASVDGSVELLARDFPEVRVIASPVNRGFAGGNNLALREVTTPYAVLLNPDTVPEPDWLAQLLAGFDQPGAERLGAVSSKVLFLPRFVRLPLATAGFRPGGADPRELGVRILDFEVDGRPVLDRLLWERLSYGPEGPAGGQWWWTRPAGELLLPVEGDGPVLDRSRQLRIRWAAERAKPVRIGGVDLPAGPEPAWVSFELPAGLPLVDVVNNAGSVVFTDGYGADRGYQQPDEGQYDEPVEVFAAGGAAMALRTAAGRSVGWFDDDFFLYYEDTDLCWRLRAAGWSIGYAPKAVVRHHHSALTKEFSPLWHFHVDRNRLLMLTKNASARVALDQVLRYQLTTASILVRALRQWAGTGRPRGRPALGVPLRRLRVTASYLRLLPAMLRRRRAISTAAAVPRAELQRHLVRR